MAYITSNKNQVIIANDITQDKHDAHQFIPQMENVKIEFNIGIPVKLFLHTKYVKISTEK